MPMARGKGSKHKRWLKDGMKESRKHFKKMWNRRTRHRMGIMKHAEYKKLCGDSIYIYVS